MRSEVDNSEKHTNIMDDTLKGKMLKSMADEYGVNAEAPEVADEWHNWSGENQHLAGSALGDAVRSFVDHLTKRGIISTTTASTEAQAPGEEPSEAHRRHVSNIVGANIVGANVGVTYDGDGDGDEECDVATALPSGNALGTDDEEDDDDMEDYEDPDAFLNPGEVEDDIDRHVEYEQNALRSITGGGADNDGDGFPDPYKRTGSRVGRKAAASPPLAVGAGVIMDDFEPGAQVGDGVDDDEEEDDYDYEGAAGRGGLEDVEDGDSDVLAMVGARTRPRVRLTKRSRLVRHTSQSSKASLIVNFAARHPIPNLATHSAVRQKMENQGTYLGADVAAEVASYIQHRKNAGFQDTKRQQDHLRAVAANAMINMLAAVADVSPLGRSEGAKALNSIEATLKEYFEGILEGQGTPEQYARRRSIRAEGRFTEGVSALGSGLWHGTKKVYTGTRRSVAKTQSVGRALLNSSERQAFKSLVIDLVRTGRITAHDVTRRGGQAFGTSLSVRSRLSTVSLEMRRKVADRAKGTEVAMVYLLLGAILRYVTDDKFQPFAPTILENVFPEIARMRQVWHYPSPPQPQPAESTAAAAKATTAFSGGKYYTHDDSGYHGTTHRRAAPTAALTPADRLQGKLLAHAEAYLRNNPSQVSKAGTEFALLVPSDYHKVWELDQVLSSGNAEEKKRYLHNALLGRHPNKRLERTHMLSLAGRPFRVHSAAAPGPGKREVMRLDRMRRMGSGAKPKHEDVWDTEMRDSGGALVRSKLPAMHCEKPARAADAVHVIHPLAGAGAAAPPIEIRPLHYRYSPQYHS